MTSSFLLRSFIVSTSVGQMFWNKQTFKVFIRTYSFCKWRSYWHSDEPTNRMLCRLKRQLFIHFSPHNQTRRVFSNKMLNQLTLKYVKLSEHAHDPVKGSDKAAGFDLRSAYNYTVKARGKELVKTDLQIEVPEGCYGRIAPRSGLAWKNFIDVGAGVIDMDYRGNVGVVIFNHGDSDFIINEGDRIAQLICEQIAYPCLQEVTNLNETKRGIGGFGSTGIKKEIKTEGTENV